MISIENRLQHLEDEAAIRNLVARFADACVTADYEAFGKLWSADGKWTIHEPFLSSSQGNEKIVEMMTNLRKEWDFFVQFAHSGIIKLNGEKATARWIMHEAAKGPNDNYYNNFAVYVDSMQKIDGVWKFIQRDYHYMWLDAEAFPGDVFALPSNLF